MNTRSLLRTDTEWNTSHDGLMMPSWLVGLLIAAVGLSSCVAPTQNAEDPPSGDRLNAVQAVARPLDCSLMESFASEIAEGTGHATPQQALDSLDSDERPPGEPTFKVEEESLVTWVFLDNEDKVGSVIAQRAPWGLWIISGAEWCASE